MAPRYRSGSTLSLDASARAVHTTREERARENATMRSAVAAPMAAPAGCSERSFHFFLEALGRSRLGTDVGQQSLTTWEVLPGLQWRMNPNMWMSSGVVLPVGQNRTSEMNHLQFTCFFQF